MSEFSWDRSPVSRRSLLAAGGLTGVGLLAAACGGNTGRASGGGDSLSQWYHEYGEEGVEAAVKKYAAAYKDAKVTVTWIPGDGYDSKLAAALLDKKQAPDAFESQVTVDKVRAGQLADLTDLIADTKDDWVANAIEANTVDGTLYGIPQAVDMQLLVWRPSLAAKAGFPDGPKSLDELIEMAKAQTTGAMKGLFVGNDGGAGVFATPAIYAAGLTQLTKDQKIGFDDPAAAAVLGQLQQLKASGSLLLGAPTDWYAPDALINDQAAMQWTGLWTFPLIKEKFADDFKVSAFPAAGSAGKQAVPFGSFNAMAYKPGAKVDAAKAFVKWLWVDQVDYQTEFETKFGFHIPPRKSIAEKAENLKDGQGAAAVTLYQDYGYTPGPYWTPAMGTAFSDAVTNVLTKNADPTSELQTAIGKINKELAKK